MNPDDVWNMALELSRHHRLDPNTSRDRCTCGHEHKLGELTTAHIAQALANQGWVKP